jgi:4-hydroxybenzoate polyprenyltransferase
MKKIISIVKTLRIKQWVKNAFILFPIIFAGQITRPASLLNVLKTFVGFCLVSSSIYILNDIFDRKEDQFHPKKSNRPIAKGEISIPAATVLLFIFMTMGLWICLSVDPILLYIAAVYIFLHLIYNYFTKRIVILDVIFVAMGFLIRIWAGSYAADVLPSQWLQLCVFLLALFLGFTKRRFEIANLKEKAADHRSVLAQYTVYLLDQIIIVCSTLAIVFYGLYTISPEVMQRSNNMLYTIVFVIYGIFRYLYLLHVKKLGDDPGEMLFLDKPLLIDVVLWITCIFAIIYFSH